LALAEHLTNQGQHVLYHYLPLGEKRFRGHLHAVDILLLDEMQRLSKTQRTRLLGKIAPRDGNGLKLICSTHEDLTLLFERRNRLLTTIHLDIHEERFVRQIIERRLQFFALDNHSKVKFSDPAYRLLTNTFKSDLRSLEIFLYTVFQQQDFESEITDEILKQAMEVS
jgi:chromosomal replication initiation ATPase DnaA